MRRIMRCRLSIVLAAFALGTSNARADEQPAQISTAPPPAGRIARAAAWGSAAFGDGSRGDGFYPELGHMVPGAGLIKGGPGYRHHLFDRRALVDASAAASWRRYSMVQASIEWPEAFGPRVGFAAAANYADSTQVSYFGIGSAAPREARTNYRVTGLDATAATRMRLGDSTFVTGTAGLLTHVAVSPGLSTATPSIEQRFNDATAPGLRTAPRYVHADLSIEHDSRDRPNDPTRGGMYRITTAAFHDVASSAAGFQRVDADAVRYLPLFHDRTRVVIHGRVTMSHAAAGDAVPFYMLPTLGGVETLPGYGDYRFRDRNAAVLNVEYRWRALARMDAALFTDIGTVAPSAGDLLHQRRSRDYGAGVRLHSDRRTIGRLDIARSPEGMRLVFSVSAPFTTTRRTAAVPYVP